MTPRTKITDLRDYPAIKKLASALHRMDARHHGAAIMVGAGFTRSAALHVGGEKKVPLWGEFTRSLARDLYGDETTFNFTDPLRVAEEYRTYFGQGALNERIRNEIDDKAWRMTLLKNVGNNTSSVEIRSNRNSRKATTWIVRMNPRTATIFLTSYCLTG